jgi:copper chaperone CopZ
VLLQGGENMKQTLTVKGMHCNSCKVIITEVLEDAGAKDVHVDLDEKKQVGTITLSSDLPKSKLKEMIEKEGEYKVI